MNDKRIQRINSEMKKSLSKIFLTEIKDPRINKIISLIDVKVSRDLMFADIYISVFGDKKEQDEAKEALIKSKGYIKTLLSKEMQLRSMPELRFKMDNSIEEGVRINKLIQKVMKEDATNE